MPVEFYWKFHWYKGKYNKVDTVVASLDLSYDIFCKTFTYFIFYAFLICIFLWLYLW